MEDQMTPQKHVDAAMDSVNLINSLIEAGDLDAEITDTITRNYKHLEIVLESEYISEFPTESQTFAQCVEAAKQFIG